MLDLNGFIIKDIVNTLVHDDPDFEQLLAEATNNVDGDGVTNSKPTAKWDSRYNSLILVAKKYNLKFGIIKRGNLWKAAFIVGEDNSVHIFFSHQNLKKILKKGNKNHYFKLLNFFNRHMDGMKPLTEQLKWDLGEELNPYSDEWLAEQAREILHMLNEEPSKVVVFAFDKSFTSTVNAYIFNSKNEPVWHENYTSLIDSEYTLALNPDNIDTEKKDSTTPVNTKKQLVKLKKPQ